MKPALLALALVLFPIAASADEAADRTRCDAAFRAFDWPSVTLSCKAYAGDRAADSATDTGGQRALDLWSEGVSMASVGLAYAQLHDATDSKEAYSAARQALGEAQSATNDPLVLDMIEREFDELPPP